MFFYVLRKKRHFLFCLFLCFLLQPVFAQEDLSVHKSAWVSTLSKAEESNYYKYSIYASRILAVRHPEIYLEADRLFLRAIDKKELFNLTKERASAFKLLPRTFSLEDTDFTKYSTVTTRERYPKDVSVFPYLDRRMLSPAGLLREKKGNDIVDQTSITQIELASLMYARQADADSWEDVYILYCKNEDTFVYISGELISVKTQEPYKKALPSAPILIFNQRFVWYPLMKRDDSAKSELLKELVQKYSKEGAVLLSEEEQELYSSLFNVTQLNKNEYDRALLFALRVSSFAGFRQYSKTDQDILLLWRDAFPDIAESELQYYVPHTLGGLDDFLLQQVTKRANYLSPLSSYIAAQARLDEDKSPTVAIYKLYKSFGFEWNSIWTMGFEQMIIDESFISKNGMCEHHANNLSAILDLANIRNNTIHSFTFRQGIHQVVYLPEYDQVFSNTDLNICSKLSDFCRDTYYMISEGDDWALFVDGQAYYGTMPSVRVGELLMAIQEKYNDDIQGLHIGDEVKVIPFSSLMASLMSGENNRPKQIEL